MFTKVRDQMVNTVAYTDGTTVYILKVWHAWFLLLYSCRLTDHPSSHRYTSSHLSIGKQSVHSLQEAALQHVGLIHDEHNLLISASSTTQYLPQVIIKVSGQILAVNLGGQRSGVKPKLFVHFGSTLA